MSDDSTKHPDQDSTEVELEILVPTAELEGRSIFRKILPFVVAYCVPFTVMYFHTMRDGQFGEFVKLASRSGLVGLAAAVLVLMLAKIDAALGSDHLDKHSASLVQCLAVMLWMFFVFDGHAMLVAADEVSAPPDPIAGRR